ncbi:MAG: SUMF1/EgtB/PvdO family nonheme iron enzyme [Phycisphaerae bacterium]
MSHRTLGLCAALVFAPGVGVHAEVVIETVTVGNPGNAGEWSGESYGGSGPDRFCGAVDYVYNIGAFEVTNSQYAEFLNAVATLGDPNSLYKTDMGGGWNDIGGISRSGSGTEADPWVYAARPNRGSRPVNYVSWYDALRFANWMHNGQATGPQNASSTEDGAYDMSLGTSVARNPGARVFLPSEDEWYKAAYYKGDGTDAGYWDYPTRSDTAPVSESPFGTDMTNGSANYYNQSGGYYVDPTYYTTAVGAYSAKPSDSAYGTFDQGGNLREWNEEDIHGDGSSRGVRGGSFGGPAGGPFGDDVYGMHAAFRWNYNPASAFKKFGFRVGTAAGPIPTVSAWGLIVLATLLTTAGTILFRSRRAVASA